MKSVFQMATQVGRLGDYSTDQTETAQSGVMKRCLTFSELPSLRMPRGPLACQGPSLLRLPSTFYRRPAVFSANKMAPGSLALEVNHYLVCWAD